MSKNTIPKTIYAIYCRATKRTYIGCCADFKMRIKQHFRELDKGDKKRTVTRGVRQKTHWQDDYDKYGRDEFDIYILESDIQPELCDTKEREYILKYRSDEPEYGYNIRRAKPFDFEVAVGTPPLPATNSASIAYTGQNFYREEQTPAQTNEQSSDTG